MRRFAFTTIGSLAAVAGLCATAQGAAISGGLYQLHNHPDGGVAPPGYGLRLDELYNVTGGNDIFTFDFDHPDSNVRLDYDFASQEIEIFGQVYGGRDAGGSYFNDAYRGIYTLTFKYDTALGLVTGDDDLWVTAPSGTNTGTISTPLGDNINLSDKSNGSYTFRFGDESNDLGHRGFAGISGWGWLMMGDRTAPNGADDWLFTATQIPEPASIALLVIGMLTRRR